MLKNTKSTEDFNYVRVPDRASAFANTVLGIVEDAAKDTVAEAVEMAVKHVRDTLGDVIRDAIECALYAARAPVANALRDEIADLTRQVLNDTAGSAP
jgi:hypothetical protein